MNCVYMPWYAVLQENPNLKYSPKLSEAKIKSWQITLEHWKHFNADSDMRKWILRKWTKNAHACDYFYIDKGCSMWIQTKIKHQQIDFDIELSSRIVLSSEEKKYEMFEN